MSYYDIQTGFFPVPVKACFSVADFEKTLKQMGCHPSVAEEAAPLEKGIAETHSFEGEGFGILILVVYNLEVISKNICSLAGVIAHETVHVVERILEYVGEKRAEFGEESRAYLTQCIVEQMFEAASKEIFKLEKRSSNRKKAENKSGSPGGNVSEVGQPEPDGSSGQDSSSQGSASGGGEGPTGQAVSQTDRRDKKTK